MSKPLKPADAAGIGPVKRAGDIHLRVLYLFAGAARHADFGQCLQAEVDAYNATDASRKVVLVLREIDTHRGGKGHNLLDHGRQEEFVQSVRERGSGT